MKFYTIKYCGICGDEITKDRRKDICSSPYCNATIMVYHNLLNGEQIKGETAKMPQIRPKDYWIKQKNLAKKLNESILSYMPDYKKSVVEHIERKGSVTQDPRGINNEEKNLIFSHSSSISCLYKIESEGTDKIGMTIRRRRQETTKKAIIRLSNNHEKYLSTFDVTYAWRCGCSIRTTVVYETLDHLPKRAGYYGECPRCRSHALCIETEK